MKLRARVWCIVFWTHGVYCLLVYIVCFPTYPFFTFSVVANDNAPGVSYWLRRVADDGGTETRRVHRAGARDEVSSTTLPCFSVSIVDGMRHRTVECPSLRLWLRLAHRSTAAAARFAAEVGRRPAADINR